LFDEIINFVLSKIVEITDDDGLVVKSCFDNKRILICFGSWNGMILLW